MKVEGQDPLIKLLWQLSQNNASVHDEMSHLKPDEALEEMDKILAERDQVLLRGDKGLLEVQYSRKTGETAKEYLHRISTETSRRKDSLETLDKEDYSLKQDNYNSMINTALYHELGKPMMKEIPSKTQQRNIPYREKFLYIFIIIMFISIISYIVL